MLLKHYLISSLTLTSIAFAESKPEIDKTKFNLFNPVPEDNLRDLNTDDCPYTVDPGHIQIETVLYSYIRDRLKTGQENTRTQTHYFFRPNIRLGLLHNLEMGLIVPTYTRERVKDRLNDERETHNGFGDIILRLKYNLWGNKQEGNTAIALQPFVKLPTNHDHVGNKYVEGGILAPLDIKLSEALTLSLSPEIDVQRGENENKHVAVFIFPASFSYTVTEAFEMNVGVNVERVAEKQARWNNSLQLEAKFTLSENCLVNMGANIGMTKAADDFNPFVGVSYRF